MTFPYTVTGDATLFAQWVDRQPHRHVPARQRRPPPRQPDRGLRHHDHRANAARPHRLHVHRLVHRRRPAATRSRSRTPSPGTRRSYAQWTIDSHTVTFEPGNGDAATSISADYGTTVAAPAQPVRTGYTFAGWFTAATGGTEVTFPYTVTGDTSSYAQWTIDATPSRSSPSTATQQRPRRRGLRHHDLPRLRRPSAPATRSPAGSPPRPAALR